MKAQTLYDLRQLTGYVSGTDLHEFFWQQIGDPSPKGDKEIQLHCIPQEVEDLKLSFDVDKKTAIKMMKEYSVSPEAILCYQKAFNDGATVEECLRLTVMRDEQQ
jgi:hypothetical protein